jgi:hypothetical protein
VVRPLFDPAGADRTVLRELEREWRAERLTAYRSLVKAEAGSGPATFDGLTGTVEHVALAAGEYLWYFAATGGAAWKMEMVLARF